jgi:very-short-patch-repair endonuclease
MNQLTFITDQSEAEHRFLEGCIRAGWTDAAANTNDLVATFRNPAFPFVTMYSQLQLQPVIGVRHRADFCLLFPDAWGIVVNIDGYTYHCGKKAFDTDRRLDREIQACGWSTFRYPAWSVLHNSRMCDETVANLHSYLAGKLATWSRRTYCSKVKPTGFYGGEGTWTARCDGPTAPLLARAR